MPSNPEFWIETLWRLPKDLAEGLNTALEQMGSLGSYERMGLLPEDEDARTHADVIAYFPDTRDLKNFEKKILALASDEVVLEHCLRIPRAEWATEWKKYFKPFFLTPEIVIRPSWEPYSPKADEKIVTLDPGMAFGTGQHDTTKFCAELLCELKHKHPGPTSLIDVGCGSGILSIIARKVGYAPVIGIDIEGPAIETAQENLERNPDATPLDFHLTDGSLSAHFLKPADVVAANIIAEALCELHDDLIALVKPQGHLILSGILPQRADMVKTAFEDLTLVQERTSNDWHAYVYRRS